MSKTIRCEICKQGNVTFSDKATSASCPSCKQGYTITWTEGKFVVRKK